MLTLLKRRGIVAIVFALVAAACSGTATGTTTTTSAATTTTAETTATTTTETTATTATTSTTATTTTTTTAAGGSTGTGAIIDVALPYVTPGGDEYDYAQVDDDSGILSVNLPTVWNDVDGTAWFDDDRNVGSSIVAAASLDTFYSDFSAPGTFIGTSDALVGEIGPEDITDEWDFSASCSLTSTDPISTGALDGQMAVWTDCGDTGASLLTFVALPPDEAYLAVLVSIVLSETDVEAFAAAIDSLATDIGSLEALSPSGVAELVSSYVGSPDGASETGFIEVQDDAETMTVRVPANWVGTDGGAWEVDGADVGPTVVAAPDLDSWVNGWDTPGVFYAISEELAAPDDLGIQLDQYQFSGDCTGSGRFPFEGLLFTGVFDLWTECGGTDSAYVVMAAYRPDKPVLAFLQILVASPEDVVALETILDSFDILRSS
jgi:hypothetical protein